VRFPTPAVALIVASLAVPARAQTQGFDVEAMHQRAIDLRARHDDAGALALFEEIYRRTHEPRALARMGLAEFALHRWVDAEAHLSAALAVTGDPWIERSRTAPAGGLERALTQVRSHLGRLMIRCAVPRSELWMGGRRVAALPLASPLRVEAGEVQFEVRAASYVTTRRSVPVPAGSGPPTEVDVALVLATSASDSPPSSDAPQVVRERGAGPWPWVFMGVGAASIGAGFILRFVAQQGALDDLESVCRDQICAPDQVAAGQRHADQAALYGSLSLAAFGAGAAGIVGGIIWAVVARPTPSSGAARTMSLQPTFGAGTWGLGVRF